MTTLFTIGHSNRSLEALVALLQAHGIRRVVDVRRFPRSRRHPWFDRESLEQALPAAGIAYEHLEALGGRRPVQAGSPNAAWQDRGFRGYADHTATGPFQAALHRVFELAEKAPTALLCAEAVPWRCHRRIIADVLLARGHTVHHVLDHRRADPHALHASAHVTADGAVTWPGPEQQGLFDGEG